MTLAEYQQGVARTMNAALTGTERLIDAGAGLAEEAGEVLAHVRKHAFQGHALDRERLATELGDALWCLAATATAAGLSLGDVAANNLEKLRRRYPDGFTETASRAKRQE
jgi:NTP pyrophosphatase (non-canonical NTP hydrolase)